MDVSRFQVVTFDCYGTLIDWETGILSAVRPVLASHGVSATDDEIIAAYADLERRIEAGPYMKYRDVLRAVMAGLGTRFKFDPTRAECDEFAASVVKWPAFDDTAKALKSLQQRVKVAIVSNVDEDLFAGTKKHLGIEPDFVITAEHCRSYKPSRNNFETALRVLAEAGIPRERVLHAAESVYHDVEPAKGMGIATVWVNRRGERGPGASGAGAAVADLEIPNLRTLSGMIERGAECSVVRDSAGRVTGHVERKYFADGTPKEEFHYRGSKVHGPSRYFHPNGVMASEMWYEDGLVGTSTSKTWNAHGTLLGEVSYVDGRQMGRLVLYHPDGKVWLSEYYLKRGKTSRARYAAACLKDPTLPRYPELEEEMEKARAIAAVSEDKDAARRNLTLERARGVSPAPVTQADSELTARLLESRVAEALGWLVGSREDATRTLGEMATEDSIAFVENLYERGAERVLAVEIQSCPGTEDETTNTVLVQLPRAKAARRKLFSFEKRHAEAEGFDGEPDAGQAYLFLKLC